ncbi:Zn-dependent protease [Haloactinopolyspora alba]|uniref:Zinc metalloprotease n=1 Tax=Haloactinopolyspora alba TaxID=648780 RepID=A0A2P8D9G0_9ACTN|nr:site-2 protease family protein [Haloactinopolyspora alba]PSK93842.1 Zn-dependent protease [Haloactinopolyspora alba]
MTFGSGRSLRLGRVAGIPVHVSPTWFLVAAVITIGFEPFVSRYLDDLGNGTYAVSFAFAVLLYGSVFLHEVSHALTALGLGLPVRGITLHFLGGYTEIERDSPTPGRDLVVSAAGPLLSLVLGAGAYVASRPVHGDVTEFLLFELAAANLVVGVFNLLPALPLDGGHMLRAVVWRVTGDENRGTVVAGRAGQVLAVLVLVVPFAASGGTPDVVGVVWAALVAMLLWSGATQALTVGRMRARLPALDPRRLARPAAPVAPDVPLSEALKTARGAGVTSLVVVDSAGRPTGVLNEAAAAAVPQERRPWVTVGQSSRTLTEGLVVGLGVTGDELLRVMRETPASEYLVVDEHGRVYGVLASSDVDAALAAR